MIERFAHWRYRLANDAYHAHLEHCMVCEWFDEPCDEMQRIISRRAYWLARAGLLAQVVHDNMWRFTR